MLPLRWMVVCAWGLVTGEASDAPYPNHPAQQESHLSPALKSLQILGDHPIHSKAWQTIFSQRAQYLSHLHSIREALEKGRANAWTQRFGETQMPPIDPWGEMDQPTHYTPSLGPLRYWTGKQAPTPMPPRVEQAIPNRYLLAEAMGIGTNRVDLSISIEDGQLYSSTIYGFHIAARERYALTGLFQMHQAETPIQTFQRTILSRGRVNTQNVHIGPDVKPHQTQLNRVPIEDLPNQHHQTLWEQENLHLKFPSEFDTVTPSPKASRERIHLEHKLTQSIRSTFLALRKAIVAAQWKQLEDQGIPEKLDPFHRAFMAWESAHTEDAQCPMPLKAERLLDSAQLKVRIQTQVDADHPWEWAPDTIADMEHLLNASLAHGLAHRVPASARNEVLQCYLALQEEEACKN